MERVERGKEEAREGRVGPELIAVVGREVVVMRVLEGRLEVKIVASAAATELLVVTEVRGSVVTAVQFGIETEVAIIIEDRNVVEDAKVLKVVSFQVLSTPFFG